MTTNTLAPKRTDIRVAPNRAVQSLDIAFWGVRGSIPTPGKQTAEYGGNTTCLEVRGSDGGAVIIDAGSGIRELGMSLLERERGKVQTKLFITHTHWDHIQGFPFFAPAYVPGCSVEVYCGKKNLSERLVEQDHTRQIFAGQQDVERGYFPIGVDVMKSATFHDINGGQTVHHGSLAITPVYHNAHPGGMFAYHLQDGGRRVVFTGDYEHDGAQGYQFGFWDRNLIATAWNADALIIDAQYTPVEYEKKKGWGHSTIERVCEIATEAAVKRLYITHHDPLHTDTILASMEKHTQEYMRDIIGTHIPVSFAREGMHA